MGTKICTETEKPGIVPAMKFDAIFFDNDGILVETDDLFFQACKTLLKDLVGYELSRERYSDHILMRGEGFLEILSHYGYTEDHEDELRKKRTDIYLDLLRKGVSPIPEVESTLQKLHKKLPLGVVTAAQQAEFEIIHSQLGLLPYFDFIVHRDDVVHSKPHPEGYLLAAERAKVSPENCLVIEDSPRGIAAAQAAGMTCWCIPTEQTKQMDISAADQILDSISELPTRLKL